MAQEISNTRPVSSLKTQNPSNTLAWWHHFKACKSGETPTPPVFCTMAPWLMRRFMLVLHAKVHLGLSARSGPWILIGTQHDETLATSDYPTSQIAPLGRKFQAKQKLLGEILDQENLDDLNFGNEHIKTQFKQNLHSLGFCTWQLQPLQFLVFHLLSCSFLSCFIWVAKEILVIAQRPDNNLGPRFHGSPGQMANIEFVGKEPSSPVSTGECNYCMDEWWKTGMIKFYEPMVWSRKTSQSHLEGIKVL